MKQGGDDLGDDFVVDDLVAFSGDEDAAFDDGVLSDSRDAISGEEDGGDRSPPTANTGTERKRKRREKEKDRKAKVCGSLPANYVQLISSLLLRN